MSCSRGPAVSSNRRQTRQKTHTIPVTVSVPSRPLRQSDPRPGTLVLAGHTFQQSKVTEIWSIQLSFRCRCSKFQKDTTYRPPTKWRPVKCLTNGFGAVRLTRVVGINVLPRPVLGGPCSMSQDDGASTDVTGSFVSWRAWMTAGNGSRTSPEKLNPNIRSDIRSRVGLHCFNPPNIASTIWSASFAAYTKSSTNGT